MSETSDKIGHINELEEKIEWPKVNVVGKAYAKPASTHSINKNDFVVLPRMITPDVLKAIDAVKASITALPVEEADVKKKGSL